MNSTVFIIHLQYKCGGSAAAWQTVQSPNLNVAVPVTGLDYGETVTCRVRVKDSTIEVVRSGTSLCAGV